MTTIRILSPHRPASPNGLHASAHGPPAMTLDAMGELISRGARFHDDRHLTCPDESEPVIRWLTAHGFCEMPPGDDDALVFRAPPPSRDGVVEPVATELPVATCSACKGTKRAPCMACDGIGVFATSSSPVSCSACNGTGRRDSPCQECS